MKLQANTGWVIVRRAEPVTTTEGGIIVPAKPGGKVDRGVVVSCGCSADGLNRMVDDGWVVLFKGGEPFDHGGEKLLALKTEDVIGMEA